MQNCFFLRPEYKKTTTCFKRCSVPPERLPNMVAVRAKVGARGFQKTKALAKGKKIFKIDASIPAADGIFTEETTQSFEQYFQEKTKLHGRKGKLSDKVKISLANNIVTIATTMCYRKKYFKYLTKKFLKKKNLRDFIRILAKGKDGYELRYFNINDEQDQE